MLIVLLVGLCVFAFSDPHGFCRAFVPFLGQRLLPARVIYLIGGVLMLILMTACFTAGRLTTCLVCDFSACSLF